MQNRIARLRKKLSEEKRFVSIDQARIITQEMLKESMPFPGIKNTPIVKSNLGNESNLWCTCTLYIKEN